VLKPIFSALISIVSTCAYHHNDVDVCYRLRALLSINKPLDASIDPQGRFEMLTPAGLEVQIFVDPKEAKNIPAKLKEKVRKEDQSLWKLTRSSSI